MNHYHFDVAFPLSTKIRSLQHFESFKNLIVIVLIYILNCAENAKNEDF